MDEVVTPWAESHEVVGAMQPPVTPVGEVMVVRRVSHPPLTGPALWPVPLIHLRTDHLILSLALLPATATIAGGRAWTPHCRLVDLP